MRLCESLADLSDHFSDAQKRTMLENAVVPVKALRAMKTQANQLKIHSSQELTYNEYSTLIMSAATTYDA